MAPDEPSSSLLAKRQYPIAPPKGVWQAIEQIERGRV
jgi:hypothetical protein